MPIVSIDVNRTRVVKRFGVITHVLGPGVHMINPFFDSFVRVQWKFEHDSNEDSAVNGYDIPTDTLRFDPDEIECTTADSLDIGIDLLVEFRIVDARLATATTNNLYRSIEASILSALYSSIRSLKLEHVTPQSVEQTVSQTLDKTARLYGFETTRVFVENIMLPDELSEATVAVEREKRQMIAELSKRKRETELALAQQRERLALQEAESLSQSIVAANAVKCLCITKEGEIAAQDMQLQQDLKKEREMREVELLFYKRRLDAFAQASMPAELKAQIAYAEALIALAKDPATKLVLPSAAEGGRLINMPLAHAATATITQTH